MSRHKETRITLAVRLIVPRGSNVAIVTEAVRAAVKKLSLNQGQFDMNQVTVVLVKKETTYG